MKKLFRVGLYHDESGHVTLEADSKEEAERLVQDELAHDGLEGVAKKWSSFKATDREYNTTSVEEL